MSQDPADLALSAWLHEQTASPAYLQEVLERTRRQSQRPAWSVPERWIPMLATVRRPSVPRQLIYLAVLALLVVVAVAALVASGARPVAAPVAPPFGLAGNGLVAFDRVGHIVVAKPDGTDERDIVTTVPDARGPVFSPDGSRLAFFGTVDGASAILVSPADGQHPIAVSRGVVLDRVAMEAPPSWSPDGLQVVFSGLVGEQRQLYVAAVDGSGARVVGDAELSRMDPTWSPDGSWIAFHGYGPAAADAGLFRTIAGLYIIRPDGRDQKLLAEGEGGSFIYRKPQWLPDPARSVLAYSVGEPSRYDIALFDVRAGSQAVVSEDQAAELWPAWAPDGSAIAWAASDGRIRIARADGTIVTTAPSQIDYEFAWSPDGRLLLGLDGAGWLVTAPADGSPHRTEISFGGLTEARWSWQRLAP